MSDGERSPARTRSETTAPKNPNRDSEPVPEGPQEEGSLQPAWREDFKHIPESERLDRLLADLELLNDVRAEGFEGPASTELYKGLAEYGYQVIGSWIRTGVVFGRLAEKGKAHYLARYPKRVPNPTQAYEMAHDVVADALVAFRDEVLRPGIWDHRRGASLATFFVGQCLLRFPKVYIEWLKATTHSNMCVPDEEMHKEQWHTRHTYDDPALVTLLRSRLSEGRDGVPVMTRAILLLAAEGYSHREISQMLDISVGAIESRLHRHNKNCERRRMHDTA